MRITAASLALLTFMGGCANTNVNNDNDINTLPKKCGEYYVFYGTPKGHKQENGTIVGITLNGKNMSYLDAKYAGKEVAVFTWVQTIGGLPTKNDIRGSAITYYNPTQVLPLKGNSGLLNRKNIEKTCRKLAHKKI